MPAKCVHCSGNQRVSIYTLLKRTGRLNARFFLWINWLIAESRFKKDASGYVPEARYFKVTSQQKTCHLLGKWHHFSSTSNCVENVNTWINVVSYRIITVKCRNNSASCRIVATRYRISLVKCRIVFKKEASGFTRSEGQLNCVENMNTRINVVSCRIIAVKCRIHSASYRISVTKCRINLAKCRIPLKVHFPETLP